MTDRASESNGKRLVRLTTDIVSSYVSNNTVVSSELPAVIASVNDSLVKVAAKEAKPPKEELAPAVPIKKSVTPDYLVCLECGKQFKSLKRHLQTNHSLAPAEYREKWGLRPDYPMVAPNYSAARSTLAKKVGLGQRQRK
jgi:predicted transcriptional regulator